MKKITLYLCVLSILFCSGELFAQALTLERARGGAVNDTIFVNQQVQFDIRINTEGTLYYGITNGFRVYSPNGAEWTTTVGDTVALGWKLMFDLIYKINNLSITGSGADTIGFGGANMSGTGISNTFNEHAYTITIGPIDPINHKKEICLDSTFYPPSGKWKWAGPDAFPSWDGPHCYTIIDPSAPADPSNIVLSTDHLDFITVINDPAPSSQTFDILTDMDPFDFTLSESTDWLIISPTQGTADQTITTSVNPTGLAVGTYIDSIEVIAPTTLNSSQWVIVTFVVEPEPPTIDVTPTILFFNAVAGEASPENKTISISNSNVGSADLEWSVSNNESWLSLTPSSGVNSGDVTVSVDITGLVYNDYVDTIFIIDPEATNNPIKIPVNLSVGSDLPLIAVDSAFNYIIVPAAVAQVPNRDIVIFNGGAGGMTYSLTESSSRIFTLDPVSGTAPDTVSVGFKTLGNNPGDDEFDTLWVHSTEAINSPFPVVFHFHFVDIPAEIVLADTVEVNVFECDQGTFALNPQGYFHITNVVGAETYSYQVDYESELFSLEFEENSIPEFVSVVANDLQLPLGSYYDTITVSAINAINSPQSIIVKYNVIAGVATPKIVLSNSNIVFTTRENEGPILENVLIISNLYGGCMDWNVVEDIPWLSTSKTEGNVQEALEFVINGNDLTLGTYFDSLEIQAPLASNSSQLVNFELRVWKLAGDFNWDGSIDILDLIMLIQYSFYDGIPPQPEIRAADMDCDHRITISDLILLIDYMFHNGQTLCGNPY